MATFKLDHSSIEWRLDPLVGPLTAADRQAAWRLFLALLSRPDLRIGQPQPQAVRDLIATLEDILVAWPAAQLERLQPGQLGPAMTSIIELVLLPSLQCSRQGSAGPALHAFLQDLCRELARLYRFPDPGHNPPADLLDAWRESGTGAAP